MQLHRQLLVAVALAGLAGSSVGCTPRNEVVSATPSQSPVPSSVPAGPPSAIAWTWQRAADPELIHLHIEAPAAPGAFLVPWLEGITLRPCAIVVREGGEERQRTALSYDEAGRLLEVVVADTQRDALERDAQGRLLRARGLAYRWVEGRLAMLVDERGPSHREHALRYDDDGRLVGVESSTVTSPQSRERVREQWLVYDADLLVERRWRDHDGAHGTTYFVYDDHGRLARVDVESTSASGRHSVQPTVRMEYREDRLIEFGNSLVLYDDQGRASAIESQQGLRTEYRYRCG